MIRKHSLLLGFSLSAALLLAGCTSDLSQGGGSGEVPLRLSAAPTTGLTRAADGLYTQTSGFDGGEQVEVYVNSNSTHGTYQVNSTSQTALDATNAANTLYYPTTGDVNLYAVYPAASIASHTVKYDQTTEDNYKASDLMYASKTVTQANKTSTQELQFGHQLVKLKVQIIKAAGVTSVTKVEMQNVKRKVSVSANTSSMSLTDLTSASGETGTGADEDKILVFSGSNTSTETQTYAVVFPDQDWSNQDFITVTADGQTATYKLTKDDFTFGHEYTLTLNINARALGNTVSIDTWNNGGSAVINPTASELYIDIDPVLYNGYARKPSFTIKDAEDHTVATISDGNSTSDFDITWQNNTNAGTATVAAVGKGTYAGKACAKNFIIQKAPGSISYSTTAVQKTSGDAAFTNTLTATSGKGIGTVTYSSSNTSVASVNASSGQVTIQKVGSCTITATVTDGTNYTYATKTASYTLNVTHDIKQNPLWYVAPRNMSSTATTMESSEDAGYFYQWSGAMSKFAAQTTTYTDYKTGGKTITGQSGTWHLPVLAEWLSIVPGRDDIWDFDSGSGKYKATNQTVIFGYNSTTKAGISEASYWKKISSNEIHAIRFLGTPYCSAWKYELSSSSGRYLRVSATLIDQVENSQSAASSWYTSNWSGVTFDDNESAFAVQRTFYARGHRSNAAGATATDNAGAWGEYWSATQTDSSNAWFLDIFAYGSAELHIDDKTHGRSVRLFRDN